MLSICSPRLPQYPTSHWHSSCVQWCAHCRFDDIVGDQICPLDVELKWMTQISSSVYATPLITDMYADGRKDIIVPGFVHYTEVLEGPDGAKALGWPGFHKSTVHSSPLLYDIDSDGIRDVVVATYDGDIVFFKDNVSGRASAGHNRPMSFWFRWYWHTAFCSLPQYSAQS